jgi:hypothetical protein
LAVRRAAGLALGDRAAVLDAGFFPVVFVPVRFLVDGFAAVLVLVAGLAVVLAFGERFAPAFFAVVFLAAFGFVAMKHGSSVVDVLFEFLRCSRRPDVSRATAAKPPSGGKRLAHASRFDHVRCGRQVIRNGLATVIGHTLDRPNSRN